MVLESNLLSSRFRDSLYNLFNFKIYTMVDDLKITSGNDELLIIRDFAERVLILINDDLLADSAVIEITKEQAIQIIEHLKKEFNI